MLTLSLLPAEYAVCRLPADASVPDWAMSGTLFCVMRTPDELSLLCGAAQVPADVQQQAGWTAFKLHGPFDFALTGILASVLNPLKDAGIGIFALSTFDTDYVLVQQAQVGVATTALRAAGLTVLEDSR
ncbi:ACT domain-containing protein [Deinococcus ruber]|uniref:ACT domain-containing protein n=1 Tax=Deinococcus ruber TaxID=1848197 RepID=A0A918F6C0_9DEIO|nr:ACT domain-containing protein [Deinococcus ruber]GGR12327.1 ACT domain-containing protein [Deinococcus ruber]